MASWVAIFLTAYSVFSVEASFPVNKWRSLERKTSVSLKNWQDPEYRLPSDIMPTSYSIRLLPFIEEGNFTIDGHVDIFADCVNDTNSITLNSLDILYDKGDITVSLYFTLFIRSFLMTKCVIGLRHWTRKIPLCYGLIWRTRDASNDHHSKCRPPGWRQEI